jgi:hypothetical protein
MRLQEYTISLPADMFTYWNPDTGWEPNTDQLTDYAIDYVKEDVCVDYCTPACFDSWIVGETDGDEITVAVTRLTQGSTFPAMVSGTCWVAPTLESLDTDDAEIEYSSPTGAEGYIGRISVCDSLHNAWVCPDGLYRAQLVTLTGK